MWDSILAGSTAIWNDFSKVLGMLFSWNVIIPAFITSVVLVGVGGSIAYFFERKHVIYRKTIKVGDKVTFASEGFFVGEVIADHGDKMEVLVKVHKNQIYKPKEEKK